MRIIGLQGNDHTMYVAIEGMQKTVPEARLVEVDLFGNEIRHIAFDTKTGSTYDLLLQNKIYGPADLINNIKPEEFAKGRSDIAFV